MYKGQLEGFPPEIVEKMLWWQEQQGNKRDVTVFEAALFSSYIDNGFNWSKTNEGYNFWFSVINNRNFDLFFEKYPKQDVVCGVQLEKGKDYYVITDYEWIIRFDKIHENYIKGMCCIDLDEKSYDKSYSNPLLKHSLIRPATPEESEHLNQCIKAGKYVDMKRYEYEVVHCETQEQWDFVIDKLQPNSFSKSWFKPDLGICFKNFQWCEIDWYKNRNSLILSFQEWCNKFGYTFKEEFKVGDWVCAKGTGHTKDNEYFPKDVAWKIAKIVEYKDTYHVYVDKENNPNNISGGTTDINDIRKALPHEIPQSNKDGFLSLVTDCTLPQHLQIDGRVCDRVPNEIINTTKQKGLIVNVIEPKQVKKEVKLEPIKLNNHSRLILK